MDSFRRYAGTFPARKSALTEVTAFTVEACRASRVVGDTCLRLALILEELFTNTVVHGHGRDSEEPIEITLDLEPARIALTYEDTAPPHDPFAATALPDERIPAEHRPVGGLGVPLVAAMATEIEYRRVAGRNRISLVLRGAA